MEILYVDEFFRPVYDVTRDLLDMKLIVIGKNFIKAERCENNVLILSKRAGGNWWISYWWLKDGNKHLNEIKGSEDLMFSRKEINPEISLFKQVALF